MQLDNRILVDANHESTFNSIPPLLKLVAFQKQSLPLTMKHLKGKGKKRTLDSSSMLQGQILIPIVEQMIFGIKRVLTPISDQDHTKVNLTVDRNNPFANC